MGFVLLPCQISRLPAIQALQTQEASDRVRASLQRATIETSLSKLKSHEHPTNYSIKFLTSSGCDLYLFLLPVLETE
jgi:hypothetical protein